MFISTSAFSYIRSVVDDASSVRSEVAVEQSGMIREATDKLNIFWFLVFDWNQSERKVFNAEIKQLLSFIFCFKLFNFSKRFSRKNYYDNQKLENM